MAELSPGEAWATGRCRLCGQPIREQEGFLLASAGRAIQEYVHTECLVRQHEVQRLEHRAMVAAFAGYDPLASRTEAQ